MNQPISVRRTPCLGQLYTRQWETVDPAEGRVPGPRHYFEALGALVARFNLAEHYCRDLARAMREARDGRQNPPQKRPSLKDVLEDLGRSAASEQIAGVVRHELAFALDLFRINCRNRNFLVHGAQPSFPLYEGFTAVGRETPKIDGFRLFTVALETVRKTADQQYDAIEFLRSLIGPCSDFHGGQTIILPDRPETPAELYEALKAAGQLSFLDPLTIGPAEI